MNVFTMRSLSATMIAAAVLLPSLYRSAAQMPSAPPPAAHSGAQARPQSTVGSQGPLPEHAKFETQQVEAGGGLFIQNCAFCHGKDAGGGESGPDLTRSKLVTGDKNGEAIGQVIRNGRLEKGMPRFSLSDAEIMNLVAFVHSQQDKAMSQTGTRKGVEESDLQTGNADAGKRYFEGAGGCAKCHSATGDLAGVATRFTGLRLLEEMLYPRDVKAKATVKTATGQTYAGVLEYQDEFRIGLKDSLGEYHSWPVSAVTFKVDDPVEQHVEIMSKYTDSDMHNVLSYLQTLK
jgi:cytochrome c oxidase cbb3-type subunit 3